MRPLLQTITLERQGYIDTRVAGPHHCGADTAVHDGTVKVRYQIHLVVGPNDLDDNGFLVDQEALHTVMTDIASDPVAWREPCELLAVVWAERLLTWISTSNLLCTVHELTLTLSPFPHGGSLSAHFAPSINSRAVATLAMRA